MPSTFYRLRKETSWKRPSEIENPFILKGICAAENPKRSTAFRDFHKISGGVPKGDKAYFNQRKIHK